MKNKKQHFKIEMTEHDNGISQHTSSDANPTFIITGLTRLFEHSGELKEIIRAALTIADIKEQGCDKCPLAEVCNKIKSEKCGQTLKEMIEKPKKG